MAPRPQRLLLLTATAAWAAAGEGLLVREKTFAFSFHLLRQPGGHGRVLEGPKLSVDVRPAAVSASFGSRDGLKVTSQSSGPPPEGAWTQIFVEKTATDLCITVGAGPKSCEHFSPRHRMEPGPHEVTLVDAERLAVQNFSDMGSVAFTREGGPSSPRSLAAKATVVNSEVTLYDKGTFKYSFQFQILGDPGINKNLMAADSMFVQALKGKKEIAAVLGAAFGNVVKMPWPPLNTWTTITVEKSEYKFCAFLNSDAPVCMDSEKKLNGATHEVRLRTNTAYETRNFQDLVPPPVSQANGGTPPAASAGAGAAPNGGAPTPSPASATTLAKTSKTTTTATTVTKTATTVTTTVTTVTTTTTTTPLPAFESGDEAVAYVGQAESALIGDLFKNPGASVTQKLPGATLVAFALGKDGNSSTATMAVEGGAEVALPLDSLSHLGEDTACSVGIFDSDFLAKMTGESNESASGAMGAMSVSLFSKEGTALVVKGLREPIKVVLPMNRSAGQVCAYWDEARKQWRTDGVENVGEEGGPMECRVTHLTLFAAILQGFLSALTCSQLSLLSAESIQGLAEGDWWKAPIAIIFWVVVAFIVVLFTSAIILDWYRGNGKKSELFLIPLNRLSAHSMIFADEGKKEDEEAGKKGPCGPLSGCASAVCAWCKESGAVRDALDDVISRWFEYLGEIRTFVEEILKAVAGADLQSGEGESRCRRIAEAVLRALVLGAARRRASASLGLSDDDVAFIMYDKDLDKLLDDASPFMHQPDSELTKWQCRLKEWGWLHRATMKHFRTHWKSTGWRHMPRAFGHIFFVSNPFVSVFLGGNIWSCTTRVLLLTCELLGAIVVATFFYEATGSVKSRRSKCDSEAAGIWQEIGRVLAIGVVSLLVAGMPVSILSSLHSRNFKKLDYEGSPEWKKQLLIWRVQDVLLWIIGSSYLAFCVFFIMLFLANVAPDEHMNWGLSGAISLLEDIVAIPLGVAVCVPLLATTVLTITSCIVGKSHKALLEDGRASLMSGGVNVERVLSI